MMLCMLPNLASNKDKRLVFIQSYASQGIIIITLFHIN